MDSSFAGNSPTPSQVEKLRLALSTYQDGTGMNKGGTLPGWRDFERSTALAFDGKAPENKSIFDVLVPLSDSGISYGISCKMRNTLKEVYRKNWVPIEISNSAGDFEDALTAKELNDLTKEPRKAGEVITSLVESRHHAVSVDKGGNIDVTKSYYLVLQWDPKRNPQDYQLFQFSLKFPDPQQLSWSVRGKHLHGENSLSQKVIEWYPGSGGQLKYFPSVDDAIWYSHIFQLEPLPDLEEGYGLIRKVIAYFPELWQGVDNVAPKPVPKFDEKPKATQQKKVGEKPTYIQQKMDL